MKPCGFHLRRFFRPGRCNSVWKTGWFVSMFMSIGWDSSFGIPILIWMDYSEAQVKVTGSQTKEQKVQLSIAGGRLQVKGLEIRSAEIKL